MKVTFKDLKQQKFVLDVETTDLVSSVKQKIFEEKGWEPNAQKLIYSGKILKDEEPVSTYGITEKGFVVCMVSKAKAPAASSSTSNVPETPARASNVTTPAVPAAPSHTATATTAVQGTPTPGGAAEAGGQVTSMAMGAERASIVANMEAMGFERVQIDAAMRAAFFNPDRAVEYLLNGIPESAQQQAVNQRQIATPAAAAPVGVTATAEPSASEEGAPVNLFDLAAQRTRGGSRTSGGLGAAAGSVAADLAAAGLSASGGGGTPANLDFLRSNAQFQQLRQVVQQQPQMLEPILQQLGAGNPQLAQVISQNPEQFLQLLGEQADDDAVLPPGVQEISVTAEERDAIERLTRLGFDQAAAIQAYFACDKNEELAANFLFDQPDEDEASQ